jgi:YggT family protein
MFIMVLIRVIQFIGSALLLLVLASVILSYVLPPYNSIRVMVDRIVDPLLRPIRRVVPPFGMLDFSPVVLLILVQVVQSLLISILSRFL